MEHKYSEDVEEQFMTFEITSYYRVHLFPAKEGANMAYTHAWLSTKEYNAFGIAATKAKHRIGLMLGFKVALSKCTKR